MTDRGDHGAGEEALRGAPQSPATVRGEFEEDVPNGGDSPSISDRGEFEEDVPPPGNLVPIGTTAIRSRGELAEQLAVAGAGEIVETEPGANSLLPVGTPSPEKTRAQLAPWVLGILIGVLAFGAVGSLLGSTTWAHVHDFLSMVLTGVFGLAGYVVGYYFGSGSSGDKKDS